jgi:hypothetical protein
VTKVTVKNRRITSSRYAQKTKAALPLLPLNHPSKLMPSHLGDRKHVSEAYAHLSTINFTSADNKTLQIKRTKQANFQRWHIFLYFNNRTAKCTAEKIMKTLSKALGNPGKNTQ